MPAGLATAPPMGPPNTADLALHSRILANLGGGAAHSPATSASSLPTSLRADVWLRAGRELVGQPVQSSTQRGERSAETAQQIVAALRQSGCWSGEIVNCRKDGSSFICHATVTESHHPQHGVVWISIHHDISQRVQAERERGPPWRKLMEAQRLESLGLLAGDCA